MFLSVSATLFLVDIQRELTEAEREIVADRLLGEQRERFDGVRKAAYIAAGVNPATWTRAIGGQRIRPDRLVQIVKALWPESGGRWEAVPEFDARPWTPVPPWVTQGDWTGEIDNAMADVDGRFIALETRVRDLEHLVAELTEVDEDSDDRKEGDDNGTQTSTQKNDDDDGGLGGVTPLRPRTPPDDDATGAEVSGEDDTLAPAADRFNPEGDETPGGSRS